MMHLTSAFVATTGVVDYATLKTTFDGWFWVSRVASILTKWKITLAELELISDLIGTAKLLNLLELPLDVTGAIASTEHFLRTIHILQLRNSLPETSITLLKVLEKLNKEILAPGSYKTNAFASDVELLNEVWHSADVNALTISLDLAYPADYLWVESWEHLRRAFYFLDTLNAGATIAQCFAAAAMTDLHAEKKSRSCCGPSSAQRPGSH